MAGPPEHPPPSRGLPRPPRGDTAPTRAALGRPLSHPPQFPHLCYTCVGRGLCPGQQRWKPLSPHPPPAVGRRRPGKQRGFRRRKPAAEEILLRSLLRWRGHGKQGRDGTPPPRQRPNPSRRPPQNPSAAPRLTSRSRPWLRASPPAGSVCLTSSGSGVPAGSAPARLSTPASPMVPWPWGHLPPAAVPGGRERGLPPDPHPALPGRGEERLKINIKIGNYNEC